MHSTTAANPLPATCSNPSPPLLDRHCLQLVRQQTLSKEHFSSTESGCMMGKAGRVRYYQAYEENSAALRSDIAAEVEQLAEQLGCTITALSGADETDPSSP